MSVISLSTSSHVGLSRFAPLFASLASRLSALFQRTEPELGRAAKARHARRIAERLAAIDPRVAHEVMVAADRYEQGL